MLDFHLMADDKDTIRLNKTEIPTVCDYNVYDFKFCDENLCDDETILISLRIFQDINAYNLFGISKQVRLNKIKSTSLASSNLFFLSLFL